ncbi:MAG: hypothetical protein AB7G75_24995, partial [Candidatus Binatia bacterium]
PLRSASGRRRTAAADGGLTSPPNGHGVLRLADGLAPQGEYPLSSLLAQKLLADGLSGLTTLDVSASASLCQSSVV